MKHGHAVKGKVSKTYRCWGYMLQRCYNKNNKDYIHYGNRGIIVCHEWHDFENFLRDMGEKPEGLTIDRKDNDKGYNKENCKWSTQKEQVHNRRPHGKSKYIGVWSRKENNTWRSTLYVGKKRISIGNFKTELEAAKAYNDYVIENNLPNKLNEI